ncbi:NAD-dependent epimerase/dehydratase family protein [Propionivibrio dicarboxylicus]|uniref:Nucleoside-diphosphate-sugar epimerase n=1 Tax=Propionivibrio dicarboxylicus TaxID=83767 RepID=A0A1G8GZM6_9RHOO|nr:NAD-dependent epimerase/dehydratase family protein [Propionivibrio dicarboxylicus]SDH99885.1 Nucleoside-diphosphate-sugar epimerase [Propionivibrio dicarboxylicus]
MNVLILGGTGVISREIVRQFVSARHDVTVFNRGNRDPGFGQAVSRIVGDRSRRSEFEDAMRRTRYDVVIDMICFTADDARSTIRAFSGNAGQVIVTSSVAAYKRPYRSVPTIEDQEALWDDPGFPYAFHKAAMERVLWESIRQDHLPITVIRPSLTYGPGAMNIGVLRQNYGIVDRIRRGKPLVMFGDGTTPWSFTFVPDLAKAYVGIAGNPHTFGQDFHVTSEERCLWNDLYLEFGHLLGRTPEIVHLPSELLRIAAPDLCTHLYFEKSHSGLFDNTKLRSVIPDFRADVSLRDGLRAILNWYESEAHEVDRQKDDLEDRLVALHGAFSAQMAAIAAGNAQETK